MPDRNSQSLNSGILIPLTSFMYNSVKAYVQINFIYLKEFTYHTVLLF